MLKLVNKIKQFVYLGGGVSYAREWSNCWV